MIEDMNIFCNEKTSERAIELINELAASNEQYRQLSKEICNSKLTLKDNSQLPRWNFSQTTRNVF